MFVVKIATEASRVEKSRKSFATTFWPSIYHAYRFFLSAAHLPPSPAPPPLCAFQPLPCPAFLCIRAILSHFLISVRALNYRGTRGTKEVFRVGRHPLGRGAASRLKSFLAVEGLTSPHATCRGFRSFFFSVPPFSLVFWLNLLKCHKSTSTQASDNES